MQNYHTTILLERCPEELETMTTSGPFGTKIIKEKTKLQSISNCMALEISAMEKI